GYTILVNASLMLARSLALTFLGCLVPWLAAAQDAGVELFEKQIRPLFAEKCQVCHSNEQQMGGLNLETAAGFRKGGAKGPVVSVEAPDESRLLAVLRYREPVRMPPSGKLSDAEIAAVEQWIDVGAPWPEANVADGAEGTGFWSFQPVQEP